LEIRLENKAVQQSVSLPLKTVWILKKIARDYHLSVSFIVRAALGRYLAETYPTYMD